ncbi:MAG: hypothetical protein IPH71_06025 [Proteobacteria bacterium]|nr:hypothetical protein [Pseudomonadota bacterium]
MATAGTFLRGGGARVDELIARGDDLALEQRGPAVTVVVDARAHRRAAAADGILHVVGHIGHAEFQRRDATQDVLHFGGIEHAGQRHGNAVDALLADFGLGDAQRIDAVAQRIHVELDGVALALGDLSGRQRGIDVGHAARIVDAVREVGDHLLHHIARGREVRAGGEADAHARRKARLVA